MIKFIIDRVSIFLGMFQKFMNYKVKKCIGGKVTSGNLINELRDTIVTLIFSLVLVYLCHTYHYLEKLRDC